MSQAIDFESIIQEAKKYVSEVEAIIDPYDMTFLWVSESTKQLHGDAMVGKRVADFVIAPEKNNLASMPLDFAKDTIPDQSFKAIVAGGGMKLLTVRNGLVHVNGEPYIVSERIKVEELPEE